ncbi:CRAL-TRIO domain-containing protein [Forsythia ovata]|uniref:CRAL-TRIO domain-containing protein n=1 Tax=Forsythia ovata TaxID=205694 RepID=A0ABD1WKI3_9LAMI
MVKPANGTTTLAFIFKEGVMVAADSRAIIGGYICTHCPMNVMLISCKRSLKCSVMPRHDIGNSEDDKKTRLGSFKKKAIDASSKFRQSLTRRRRSSKVMSAVFEDEHDAEK